MSHLTKCNYCTVQSMQKRARDKGVELIVLIESTGDMAGWWSARYANEEKPSAYFMELTTKCAC